MQTSLLLVYSFCLLFLTSSSVTIKALMHENNLNIGLIVNIYLVFWVEPNQNIQQSLYLVVWGGWLPYLIIFVRQPLSI